jgi:hypothetical protein
MAYNIYDWEDLLGEKPVEIVGEKGTPRNQMIPAKVGKGLSMSDMNRPYKAKSSYAPKAYLSEDYLQFMPQATDTKQYDVPTKGIYTDEEYTDEGYTGAPGQKEPSIVSTDKKELIKEQPKAGQIPDKKTELGFTTGDKVGMIGSTIGTLAKSASTIINYLGDRPSENKFMEYASDSLKTLHESQTYAQKMLDYAYQDIDMGEATAKRSMMQNARGINQQRAIGFGLNAQTQQARRNARMGYASQMLGIGNRIADTELRRDQVRMSADERVDDKNKADRDAFFTNTSQDFADMGMLSQQIGNNLNKTKENKYSMNLINQLSKYGFQIDDQGNLIAKK